MSSKTPSFSVDRNQPRLSPRKGRDRKKTAKVIPANAVLEPFLREVERRLNSDEINPHGNQADPLDELVFIILSAQTESYLYRQTFEQLKTAYWPWHRLLEASEEDVAKVIWRGGLARKKAKQLKQAFSQIIAHRGTLSLHFLENLPDADVLRYLMSLSGIGIKSAKCIMMYSLGRAVFPVDTHVWRVSRRLGFAPDLAKPTDAAERGLEERIPDDMRFNLHVGFVSHGQKTCHTYFPKCDACLLSNMCPSGGKTDKVWALWRRPRGVWASAIRTRNAPSRRSEL